MEKLERKVVPTRLHLKIYIPPNTEIPNSLFLVLFAYSHCENVKIIVAAEFDYLSAFHDGSQSRKFYKQLENLGITAAPYNQKEFTQDEYERLRAGDGEILQTVKQGELRVVVDNPRRILDTGRFRTSDSNVHYYSSLIDRLDEFQKASKGVKDKFIAFCKTFINDNEVDFKNQDLFSALASLKAKTVDSVMAVLNRCDSSGARLLDKIGMKVPVLVSRVHLEDVCNDINGYPGITGSVTKNPEEFCEFHKYSDHRNFIWILQRCSPARQLQVMHYVREKSKSASSPEIRTIAILQARKSELEFCFPRLKSIGQHTSPFHKDTNGASDIPKIIRSQYLAICGALREETPFITRTPKEELSPFVKCLLKDYEHPDTYYEQLTQLFDLRVAIKHSQFYKAKGYFEKGDDKFKPCSINDYPTFVQKIKDEIDKLVNEDPVTCQQVYHEVKSILAEAKPGTYWSLLTDRHEETQAFCDVAHAILNSEPIGYEYTGPGSASF